MTRSIFSLLCLLLFFIPYGKAQTSKTAAGAIQTVLDKQAAAWNKGDIEGYMEGYWHSDSLMFIGKKGITYGWKQTLDNYRKSYPGKEAMGTLHFDILNQRVLSGRYCQVVGRWHLRRKAGDLEGYSPCFLKK